MNVKSLYLLLINEHHKNKMTPRYMKEVLWDIREDVL